MGDLTSAEEHFAYFLGQCQETGRIYRTLLELFIDAKEMSIPLLNKLAPSLFKQIFDVFRERLYLGIARLTDPAGSNGHKNLSASGVVCVFENAGLTVGNMSRLAEELKDYREKAGIKDLRNKHMAHLDAKIIVGGEALAIPRVKDLDEFFDLLQRFVEEASKSLQKSMTAQVFIPMQGGYGEQLLDWLDSLDFANVPESSRNYRNRTRMPKCYRGVQKTDLPSNDG